MDFFRIGTDLFMVLSGCLIYRSVRSKPLPYLVFLTRRLRRIYPVFGFILAAYLPLSAVFPVMSKLPADPVSAVTMVLENAAILPLAFGATPIITVSWTLGYICLFYAMVHPLNRCLRNLSPHVRTAFWMAFTGLAYIGAGRAALLPLGALLAERMQQASAPRWSLALAAGALARPLVGCGLAGTALGGIAAFALCGWVLPRPAPRPVQFLSRISYSFYLTHGLVILWVAPLRIPRWSAAPLAVAGAFALAGIVFRLVEQPLSPFTDRAARHHPGSGAVPRDQLVDPGFVRS
jgi:exopolysaccharide production protein ExoZ